MNCCSLSSASCLVAWQHNFVVLEVSRQVQVVGCWDLQYIQYMRKSCVTTLLLVAPWLVEPPGSMITIAKVMQWSTVELNLLNCFCIRHVATWSLYTWPMKQLLWLFWKFSQLSSTIIYNECGDASSPTTWYYLVDNIQRWRSLDPTSSSWTQRMRQCLGHASWDPSTQVALSMKAEAWSCDHVGTLLLSSANVNDITTLEAWLWIAASTQAPEHRPIAYKSKAMWRRV